MLASHGSPVPTQIEWKQQELGVAFSTNSLTGNLTWDFGDGGSGMGHQINHVYASPGHYHVIASDQSNQHATADIDVISRAPSFRISAVGSPDAGEPSLGIVGDCWFFQARLDVMRSCDRGLTWTRVNGQLNAPTTRDPFLTTDRATGRVFSAQLGANGECIWIAWTDDSGGSWSANPLDCGPIPFADHPKMATGPRVGPMAGVPDAAYPDTVYLCFNRYVIPTSGPNLGIACFASLDGGATFTVGGQVTTIGGLHGPLAVGPDGAVYVPARTDPVQVFRSTDGAVSWTASTVGADVGVQDPTQDPGVSVDQAGHALAAWIGKDNRLYVARASSDLVWTPSQPVLPVEIGSAVFPTIQTWAPGRVALAYLGTTDLRGNPQDAPANATWDLYMSWSTDALADHPHFFTQKLTTDPVQVGPICIQEPCADGSRNLLDFIDMELDAAGHPVVAFADGCVDVCATTPNESASRSAMGTVAALEAGPSLAG